MCLWRGTALARLHGGGKKPGMMDTVKYSTTHKDPVKAMLNAAWLLSHDPTNVGYMEGIFKNANKRGARTPSCGLGPSCAKPRSPKETQPKRFALLKTVYEEYGDRARPAPSPNRPWRPTSGPWKL